MHVPVPPSYDKTATTDDIVRRDSTLEALAKLKPVFDKDHGTVTAGNSSPLTDGAAALLVMREDRAKALGLKPLGALRAFAYAATDPGDQLLQGPAYAAPIALDRAGMTFQDIDLSRCTRPSPPAGEQSPGLCQPRGARKLAALRPSRGRPSLTPRRLQPRPSATGAARKALDGASEQDRRCAIWAARRGGVLEAI
jgi:hypothetical protein